MDEPRYENLPQATEIDVLALPGTFSEFVDWLYRGSGVIERYQLWPSVNPYRQLWELACCLQAEDLKNQMLDRIENLRFDDNYITILLSLVFHGLCTSELVASMCEKVAYEIMDKGWPRFMQIAARSWGFLMVDPRTVRASHSEAYGAAEGCRAPEETRQAQRSRDKDDLQVA